MARKDVNWRGKHVAANVRRAAAHALNDMGGELVREAKANHPGWRNQTGAAEGSIRLIQTATEGALQVIWGSVQIIYMRRLEFEHGGALRGAQQKLATQRNLTAKIKERLA